MCMHAYVLGVQRVNKGSITHLCGIEEAISVFACVIGVLKYRDLTVA